MIRSKDITDENILDMAESLGWTVNPTSDLVRKVKETFQCSDNVAGKAVGRVLSACLMTQMTSQRNMTTYVMWKRVPRRYVVEIELFEHRINCNNMRKSVANMLNIDESRVKVYETVRVKIGDYL
jgi:hypothetical protein